jgi:hypothetical protein
MLNKKSEKKTFEMDCFIVRSLSNERKMNELEEEKNRCERGLDLNLVSIYIFNQRIKWRW